MIKQQTRILKSVLTSLCLLVPSFVHADPKSEDLFLQNLCQDWRQFAIAIGDINETDLTTLIAADEVPLYSGFPEKAGDIEAYVSCEEIGKKTDQVFIDAGLSLGSAITNDKLKGEGISLAEWDKMVADFKKLRQAEAVLDSVLKAHAAAALKAEVAASMNPKSPKDLNDPVPSSPCRPNCTEK